MPHVLPGPDAGFHCIRGAIVGGGAAGTFMALQLAARGIRTTVFDRAGAHGRGLAYSATAPWHRLNVPIDKIGAPEAPDAAGFQDWFEARHRPKFAQYADRFVARAAYGDWLREQLNRAVASGLVDLSTDNIVAVMRSGQDVRLRSASEHVHRVAFAVLCLGNQPPRSLASRSMQRYIADIWMPDALAPAVGAETVLIVGTGATGIDALLELVQRGHRGPIVMLSRRGLMPLIDAPPEPYVLTQPVIQRPVRLHRVLRILRREAALAAAKGVPWQAVVDAFRHDLPELWQAMPPIERRRFLRHLRSWWLVHRHRLAPDIAALLAHMKEDGRLMLLRGRLGSIETQEERLEVEIGERDRGAIKYSVGWLVNCTGPEDDVRRLDDPLIRSLLASGLVRPGDFDIGLDVNLDGRLYAADGKLQPNLFALGAVTRMRFGEVTSAPQIRARAIALADTIATQLRISNTRLRGNRPHY